MHTIFARSVKRQSAKVLADVPSIFSQSCFVENGARSWLHAYFGWNAFKWTEQDSITALCLVLAKTTLSHRCTDSHAMNCVKNWKHFDSTEIRLALPPIRPYSPKTTTTIQVTSNFALTKPSDAPAAAIIIHFPAKWARALSRNRMPRPPRQIFAPRALVVLRIYFLE